MLDVSFAVVVLYTLVLGLVAPYITVHSEKYGALVPPTIALVTGSALWVLLTWLGFAYTDGWTWIIVMVAMPVVMMFAASRLAKARDKAFAKQLEAQKK
jgi:lipopolysaccharide export LptBFGC system permease protein LptF